MVAGWTGQTGPSYLMTDPGAGMDRVPRTAAALHHVMGRLGLSVTAETGRFATPMPGMAAPGYDQMAVTFDRRIGPVAASFGVTRLDEQATVLGGWFGGALGQARGVSWFADTAARWQDDGGWTLAARWRSGWTHAVGHGRRDAGQPGLVGRGGQGRAVRRRPDRPAPVAAPAGQRRRARPAAAGALGLCQRAGRWLDDQPPVARPTGQETLVELRHGIRLGGGEWSTHLFWRRDPGNIAMLPPERGMAVKYGLTF